jgi:hypothetical protein
MSVIKRLWYYVWYSILSWYVRPKDQLRKYLPQLKRAQRDLSEVYNSFNYRGINNRDGVSHITAFYRAVSILQDALPIHELIRAYKRVNYGQHLETLARLERLAVNLCHAGRSSSRHNISQAGTNVTDDVVILGDICGVWNFTVRYWKNHKNTAPEHYEVVNMQAISIIDYYMQALLDDIGYLVNFEVGGLSLTPDSPHRIAGKGNQNGDQKPPMIHALYNY